MERNTETGNCIDQTPGEIESKALAQSRAKRNKFPSYRARASCIFHFPPCKEEKCTGATTTKTKLFNPRNYIAANSLQPTESDEIGLHFSQQAGSPFLTIAATVASCHDVGAEASFQALSHKTTAHRHVGESYVHIAFQNSIGIPSARADFLLFRDFTVSTTSASGYGSIGHQQRITTC